MSNYKLLNQSLDEMSGNPQQIAAVQERGHCVVLAGPGSGKTRTLTTAMARALLEDVVDPRGIACITYNHECAIELETRLLSLGIESNDRIFIGTVHSFAFTQIIMPYARCVLPTMPSKLSVATNLEINHTKNIAYKRIIRYGNNPTQLWKAAEQKRRRDINRQDVSWRGSNPQLALLIEAYEDELHKQGLIDFEDMPLMGARMVLEYEWIRKSLFAKFPVLFVDEYQDLGNALHELVLQLCFKAGIRLFAVGDPDQSIYRFTGANPLLLKSLAARPDVITITLPFNYRCGTSIIEASKAALGEERAHQAPEGAHKGNIVFNPVDGELEEQAHHVMQNLIPAFHSRGIPLDQIAILYRKAEDGNILAVEAEKMKFPIIRSDNNALIPRNNKLSRLIESSALWVTGGWKLANPTFRRLSFEGTTLVFGANASPEEKYQIEMQLITFLLQTINKTDSTNNWLIELRENLVTPWINKARTITSDWDVVDKMIKRTDGSPGNPDLSLQFFSGRIEGTGRLNFSTLHSSKGREFDIVILFGMNKSNLPNQWEPLGSESHYEARRLFYVGVTRAKQELHLVFKRKHYSPWVAELYRRLKANSLL